MGWLTMFAPIIMKMMGGLWGGAGRGSGGSENQPPRMEFGELAQLQEDPTEYPGDYRRKRGYNRLRDYWME